MSAGAVLVYSVALLLLWAAELLVNFFLVRAAVKGGILLAVKELFPAGDAAPAAALQRQSAGDGADAAAEK